MFYIKNLVRVFFDFNYHFFIYAFLFYSQIQHINFFLSMRTGIKIQKTVLQSEMDLKVLNALTAQSYNKNI